jgi:hypothetical protein
MAPIKRAFAKNFESENKRESISIIALPNTTHKRLKTNHQTLQGQWSLHNCTSNTQTGYKATPRTNMRVEVVDNKGQDPQAMI